jgi:hypothetical protein
VAQTTANISASDAENDLSAECNCLLAKARGRSTPFCTCDKMAAIATLEESVVSVKGSLKFEEASTGVVHSLSYILLKDCCWLAPHINFGPYESK